MSIDKVQLCDYQICSLGEVLELNIEEYQDKYPLEKEDYYYPHIVQSYFGEDSVVERMWFSRDYSLIRKTYYRCFISYAQNISEQETLFSLEDFISGKVKELIESS